ncbi:uncharacterized protein LOC116802570 isoform X2 [Drosophila sechellia]|uniref:uncharacterized protein LOC116801980 isoform X2 n=1 Tax=Drosophila sechellia TaxID=7238 RepID=UPI0013DDC2A6|nr:uncharacterized protein LOC116801980 isoform X2 [Drosophila sechellia]XP_032582895.1 uncharacterized protein LOC116802570 isoform X2 [Drosophila sechellia]
MWNSSWLWSSFSVSSCRRSSIWILRVAGRMDFAAPRWVPWSKRRQLLWPVFCSAALQVPLPEGQERRVVGIVRSHHGQAPVVCWL